MSFDENYISKRQQRTAETVIKAVKKHLKFGSPAFTILGLNPWKYVEPDELRTSAKEIENINKYADFFVKVVFRFDEILKELVFISSSQVQPNYNALYNLWMGVLDFPVSDQFIFGRASTVSQHGGGVYGFGFVDLPMRDLQDRLNQTAPENIDQFLSAITQADNHLEILNTVQNDTQAREQMRTMQLLMKNKEDRGIDIIDKLNRNNELIKVLKSIGHFGGAKLKTFTVSRMFDLGDIPLTAAEVDYYAKRGGKIKIFTELPDLLASKQKELEDLYNQSDTDIFSILNIRPKSNVSTPSVGSIGAPKTKIEKAASDIDISTFCLPGQSVTFFQLANYEDLHENSVKAIKTLINALR